MRRARRLFPARSGPKRSGTRFPTSLLIAGIVIGSIAVGITVRSAREQIQQLSTAKSDAVQFSLAQFDVEFLRLRLAVQTALAAPRPDLDEVRLRFDIFYSRTGTFTRGKLYIPLRGDPEIARAYDEIAAFLDMAVAQMDAPDAQLGRNLPAIAAQAATLTDAVRTITIGGLNVFSQLSDRQRQEAHDVLTRLAFVLTCLFGGLVVQVLWLARLLHTSRQHAAEIADAGRRQEAIVATSIDGIALVDRNGHIVETNAAAAEMFACDGATIRGTRLVDLIAPEPGEAADARFRFLAEARRPRLSERRFELTAASRAGRRFAVEVSVDRAEMDQRVLYVVYFRDISARKAAEEALTAARDRAEAGERAKARFLAVMSHEMRTPLNGLLGSIQLLQDRDLDAEETACIDAIRVSGTHLLGLVNDVLDLSKLETAEETARREPADPAILVEEVLAPLRPLARAAGIGLGWRWAGPPATPLALDVRRLRQVLVNLVANAIKFTAEGEVAVELCMTPARDLEIRVTDTGIGIPPEDLGRIFEDFERLDSSYARKAEGTGLGLGICRRLMTVMGGQIGVASRPGAGSIFTLRFPAASLVLAGPEREPAGAAPAAPSGASRALSVLVVDDNAVNRFILRGMLTRMGHSVTEATDARGGIAAIGAAAFDLVLMDISMPDMDGMEATRRIRAGAAPGRDLPIVAVTAHALASELAEFDAAGMDGVISKPVERGKLAQMIARLSGGRPARGERACA